MITLDDRGETVEITFLDFTIRTLAVDPADGALWAGSDQGLWRCTDQGAHWSHVAPLGRNRVVDLAFDPAVPGVVYAATSGGGVFRVGPLSAARRAP